MAPAEKNHGEPRRGTGFASDTKTLTEGGPCPESTTSLPYREGLGIGGCLFATFSAPEKVREKVLFLEAFGGSFGKEAILKGPLGLGARAGDRYSSPHRCNGLPEAAASGLWERCPWRRGCDDEWRGND